MIYRISIQWLRTGVAYNLCYRDSKYAHYQNKFAYPRVRCRICVVYGIYSNKYDTYLDKYIMYLANNPIYPL